MTLDLNSARGADPYITDAALNAAYVAFIGIGHKNKGIKRRLMHALRAAATADAHADISAQREAELRTEIERLTRSRDGYVRGRDAMQEQADFWRKRAQDERKRAQLAALRSGAGEEGWQDIASAPKDGTRVDLWVQPHDAFANGNAGRIAEAWFSWGAWLRPTRGYKIARVADCGEPTHWRPVPARPCAAPALAPAPASGEE